jgi:hypothetical protein
MKKRVSLLGVLSVHSAFCLRLWNLWREHPVPLESCGAHNGMGDCLHGDHGQLPPNQPALSILVLTVACPHHGLLQLNTVTGYNMLNDSFPTRRGEVSACVSLFATSQSRGRTGYLAEFLRLILPSHFSSFIYRMVNLARTLCGFAVPYFQVYLPVLFCLFRAVIYAFTISFVTVKSPWVERGGAVQTFGCEAACVFYYPFPHGCCLLN